MYVRRGERDGGGPFVYIKMGDLLPFPSYTHKHRGRPKHPVSASLCVAVVVIVVIVESCQ